MGYFVRQDADFAFPFGKHFLSDVREQQSTICSVDYVSGYHLRKGLGFQLCTPCEIGSGATDAGFCRRFSVTHVSEETVRNPALRLDCQHHMVGLGLPYRQVIDWIVDAMRDFKGHYRDEAGAVASVPDISSILTPGAGWWFRDMIENGRWQTIADVPALRREAIERWRLISTTIQIEKAQTSFCIS